MTVVRHPPRLDVPEARQVRKYFRVTLHDNSFETNDVTKEIRDADENSGIRAQTPVRDMLASPCNSNHERSQ